MSRLDLQAVSKSYGPVRAVDRVELAVAAGGRTAIVGPSGSGKTTLLRLIAGFEQPDSGRILLDGEVMADDEAMVPAHRRRIGYLPQDGGLFPHLTVAGNIAFGMDGKPARKTGRVTELMRMVALDPALAARSPHQLSGGQQQRVALARALAQSPKLMLLDEPFSALDTGLRAATRKAVAGLLAGIGATTILVTHDQDEALSFADQIAVIRDGRLAQVGGAMDLYLRPRDQATALFMGEAVLLPAQLDAGMADCALGRIQVDDIRHRGAARIMLRPEQIELGDSGTSCQVTEVEYGGAASQVTVRMPGSAEPRFLVVKSPSVRTPQVGDQVRLSVVGAAHRLDD